MEDSSNRQLLQRKRRKLSEERPSSPESACDRSSQERDRDSCESHTADNDSSVKLKRSPPTTQEEVQTLRPSTKPSIMRMNDSSATALQARLRSFLPMLAHANDELLTSNGRSMEDVEPDETHIEMELGLGVLETQRSDIESGGEESEHSECSSNEDNVGSDTQHPRSHTEQDEEVMRKLKGEPPSKTHVGIQELG